MSSRGTYLDGDRVFLDDSRGHHTHIPDRVAYHLLESAKNSDSGLAVWALRLFDRDVLQGAVDLLDQRDACADDSCDEAAVFDLRDARPRCDAHKREKD